MWLGLTPSPAMADRRRFLLALAATSFGRAPGAMLRQDAAPSAEKSVIVAVAPSVRSRYYRPMFDDVVRFLASLIKRAVPADVVLVLADAPTREALAGKLPADRLVTSGVDDIWIRDFGPISAPGGAWRCRYRPKYLEADLASATQASFDRFARRKKLVLKGAPLVLDGGNFVPDHAGRAVVTERVFADNASLSRSEVLKHLEKMAGGKVAVLPEEKGDSTGHADGMVVWLGPKTLGINASGDARAEVRRRLKKAFPRVRIVEIPYVPTKRIWRGFADATGVYVNALTTPHAIYVPTFGIKEDEAALRVYRKHVDGKRKVVDVPVGRVARMGGSVRCLTWDARGAAAERFLKR